jgi:hypothetical protein
MSSFAVATDNWILSLTPVDSILAATFIYHHTW